MARDATFCIPALDCPDELALVERSLARTGGIEQLRPDYLQRALRVTYDPERTDAGQILQAIESSGFAVQLRVATASPTAAMPSAGLAIPKSILASAALATCAVILWAVVGIHTWYSVALLILATVLAGVPVAGAAWRALKLRALDMNVLIVIAATGAIAIGEYFEAATVMLLFNVALCLERLSLTRAQRAISSLVALSPTIAHRLEVDGAADGEPVDVEPAALQVGDRILVRPGERIPADGLTVSGESAVNQAPITGESLPVEKRPGEKVFAGTLNGEGALVVEVARRGDDTTLAHIARLIDEARTARSPTERFVDLFARRYTPAVIMLAVIMMGGMPLLGALGVSWAVAVEPLVWVQRGLVLLVIACPCALVISTPVTIVSGLHQATRRGILVKGGEFLEKLGAIKSVALDKTGTLTTGAMTVASVESFDGESRETILARAASLERHSEHPLALAILAEAGDRGAQLEMPEAVSALRGFGIEGRLRDETYYLGNARLFQRPEFRLAADDMQRLNRGAAQNGESLQAATLVWLGQRERMLGVIRLADSPRPGTNEALADLRSLGVRRVVMLTGDNAPVAQAVAETLGIDEVHADLMPEAKIELVKKLRGKAPLAMVGDGVNDAPALAAADVGIALGGQSSDTAMETADVVVMTPELRKVGDLIRLSLRCRRLLKQNIAFALGSKMVVMGLAVAGLATMWMAVAADVGASLIVIANGMRMIERTAPEDR